MIKTSILAILTLFIFNTTAIASDKALMGALLGAGVGAGIGHSVDRTGGSGKGALIGAIGGYVIGNQMDKGQQAAPPAAKPAARPATHGSSLSSTDCNSASQYVDRAGKTRNNDDRIYFLEKAIKLCPNHAQAHNDLGVAYYTRNSRHDRDRARSEFRAALDIDPNYNVARNNLNSL